MAPALPTGSATITVDTRHKVRQHDANRRYRMREKLIAIGDDCWIEDSAGVKVFKVHDRPRRR